MSDFLDQFDKVPGSQKLLLLVLMMFGIGVGYFFLFQSEVEASIENERTRYTTLSNQSAQLRAGADDIDRIRGEIQELCERQSTFLEKLPPAEEIPSLLQSINQQAELTGLSIQVFERKMVMPGPNYSTIPVELKLEGTYDQISDFFYFIGRQQRIVNVSDIELARPANQSNWIVVGNAGQADEGVGDWFYDTGEGPTAPILDVQCTLRTYFADTSAAAGGEACAVE
ncbi:MAG: type IV pilus assembly protein PilO [Bradymonadia bacterium]|jgi:type IV pilus assembly protein PilO